VEWSVRGEVAMVFYDLYATDQSLAVMRGTLRLLTSIRETAESMYRVGEGRQADVLRASVAVARMEQDTLRMVAMRDGMAARLNALLDRAAGSHVATPLLPHFPDTLPPLDALLVQAMASRPMIRAGFRDVEAADRQSALARREIWPDLTVGLQLGQSRQTMPAEPGAGGDLMPAERRTERMASLMIGTSIPIFARGRQVQMREEMLAMQRMAEADLVAIRAETRGDVARVHADLTRARSLVTLYRSTVLPQAEAAVQSAFAAYRTGNVDFMTLLDSRMAVNTYQQELFVVQADQGKAWAELERLLGRALLDPDTNALAGRAPAGGAR
jgi:outer membrane protein TolC